MSIPAAIYTDDGAKWASFDARRWFATAPMKRIVEVARSGWKISAGAADVARCARLENPQVADVLQYLMYLRHGGLDAAATCAIDAVAALEWLAYSRPEVFEAARAPFCRKPGVSSAALTTSGVNGTLRKRAPV